ncbi:MAG: hypothetical protein A2W90_06875 [Bacteroidetes bacterium GWF2_42_66]|nr:MAG: hypothetical protein A2W92_01785 [Bacteroidetes bacterium GWA2_42_15]OFY02874.1 MAG: hypothetical protein A2W89_24280 [Bacteroidetes bacterium GWE2_42_39]OFY44529.1 MAG: hypothetical protein A2W90_06875 [Bacteroidetes bacterium GWF2_42_66]HAZ04622.1 hypothetical protein [Marinilabiliales bacterium]HBL74923.1 hypothetical protein [Prolixibacteraceae bacterium]
MIKTSACTNPAMKQHYYVSNGELAAQQAFTCIQRNWLTMEMSGLATIASSWPEYSNYSIDRMTESIKTHVYPDGV